MPVNILVADDSVTMRRILEVTFAGEDANVVAVPSGDAAIGQAQELRPDIVFADLSMPGMDGYGVAQAIKSSPGLERTAVVVLACQKHPYDEAKGKACGVDDHVIKPFDTQHVIDKVQQILSQPRAAAQRPAPPRPAAPAPPAARPAAPRPAAPAPPRPSPTSAGMQAPRQRPATAPIAAAAPVAAAAASGANDLAGKLNGLGLNPEQVAGVIAISRDVIERIVWEVVPDLAETIIKEEIRRLTQ